MPTKYYLNVKYELRLFFMFLDDLSWIFTALRQIVLPAHRIPIVPHDLHSALSYVKFYIQKGGKAA